MGYVFGCAEQLYKRNIHPRVLCGPADIDRLRQQIRTGDGKKIMHALRTKLRPIIRKVLDAPDLSKLLNFYATGAWLGDAWMIAMSTRDIALVGVLDDDADAIEAARRLITDPSPGPSGGFGWETMNTIAFDLLHSHLTASERDFFVTRAAEHVRKNVPSGLPRYFMSAGGNMPFCIHMAAPLLCALAVRGEPTAGDLEKEIALAIRFLDATLHTTFHAGGFPEEDIGYGTDMAGLLAWVVEGTRRAGLYDAYDKERGCPHWPALGRALTHFVQPWGEYLSMTGDHPNVFWNRELCLARIAAETNDPATRWLLGTLEHTGKEMARNPFEKFHIEVELRRGFHVPATGLSLFVLDEFKKKIAHPSRAKVPTFFCDPTRGIVSMRSDWSENATYVVFDGSHRSPAAQGHAHASCGHFSLTAMGEYFAIAPGRYGVEQDQHNLVLVDGKSGRPMHGRWEQTTWHGLLTEHAPGTLCDFASVDSSHQHDCYWARRSVGLVKPTTRGAPPAYFWTAEDVNKSNDFREYWWTLNTSPENTIVISPAVMPATCASATITGWRKGNCLDAHFVIPRPRAYPKHHSLELSQDLAQIAPNQDVQNPLGNMQHYARPAAMVNGIVWQRPRLIAKVAGYNGRFLSLLLPRAAGALAPRVEQLEAVDNVLAVQIDFDAVQDTLIWAYECQTLEAADICGRGKWCVVRRAARTGRVIAAQIGGGTRLRVAGKSVI